LFNVWAALRIIWQTLAYRIRVREMNNLGVTASMMIAFALPLPEILYRGLYALVLNIYVYLINDFCDIALDLASAGKDQRKVRYMAEHRGATIGALLGLALLLFVASLRSWVLMAAFITNTLIIYLYSAWLKRVPMADLGMMAMAGATMTLVGIPLNLLALKLLGLLSLLCCAFQIIQVIRDEPEDRQKNVTTTAVLLGPQRTAWLFRLMMILGAAYGYGVVGSPLPLILLLALFLPLTPKQANRSWDIARLISGLVWMALMMQIYFQ
jgi:4-hydroxybenzoate polyprenyltransferase